MEFVVGNAKAQFVECKTVEEANNIDLGQYTFLDRFSASKGLYCFKIRENKRK